MKFKKKTTRLLMVMILLVSMIMPYSASAQESTFTDLSEIYELLHTYHLSGVNESELSSAAIDGMLKVLLDPYTSYFTADDWALYENSLNQNYVGIGVRLAEDQMGFYATEVFPASPAEKAGIIQGDYIMAVEGASIDGHNMDELIDSIIGPEGTTVRITIKRLKETIEFEMIRAQIQIPVVASKWFTDGLGYIRLSGFSDKAELPFIKALHEMKEKSAKGLIIDFRGNPGGYLHTATKIAQEFIEEGVLIHTKDRSGIDDSIAITEGSSVSFPVVMLLDEHSASASEVVAGALQDYGLVTVIGRQSFGKGSVQSLVELSSGGVLKMTIEEYLTPKYNKVNQVGITPDIDVQGAMSQFITAFHSLGMHGLELTARKNSVTVNDIAVDDTFDYLIENNKVYVHSRVLASLMEAQISWNGETKAVEITKGDAKGTFLVSSDRVKLIAGTTLIELDSFKSYFNDFGWSMKDEQFTMKVNKENSWNE